MLSKAVFKRTARAVASSALAKDHKVSRASVGRRHQTNDVKNASVPLRQLSETFINGTSANYVEEMWEAWRNDPKSVHVSWATYFKNVAAGAAPGEGWAMPPTIGSASYYPGPSSVPSTAAASSPVASEAALADHMKLMLLIRAYQVRGHVLAKLDPLEITKRERPTELKIETYGFTESDLNKEFFLGGNILSGILSSGQSRRTLGDIIRILEQTYCGTIGVEYMHIQDRLRSNWIRERFETVEKYQLNKDQKIQLIDRLIWATDFEKFLAMKWGTAKRFALTFSGKSARLGSELHSHDTPNTPSENRSTVLIGLSP
jgi:2-oxoglutarate dehydrogenase E1 component